jgi:hypothetical protein
MTEDKQKKLFDILMFTVCFGRDGTRGAKSIFMISPAMLMPQVATFFFGRGIIP